MATKLSSHDRRVTLPPDVYASMVFYVEDERGRIQDPITRKSITVESMTVEVIRDHLTKMKHYPPKDKVPQENSQPDIMIGS